VIEKLDKNVSPESAELLKNQAPVIYKIMCFRKMKDYDQTEKTFSKANITVPD